MSDPRPAIRRARRLSPARLGTDTPMDLLEPRQLLAVDLAVSFDTFSGAPRSIIPGDTLRLPIIVANQGSTPAVGRVTIKFYLSSNATFDAGDTEIASFANQQVQLDADGTPNSSGTFAGDVTVPTTATGNYFFIARLIPASGLGDFNQSNDVAATADSFALKWMFGTFDGRTNSTLTLTGADGVQTQFGLTGSGSGTVTRNTNNTDRFDVAVTGTGAASVLGFNASGGTGPNAGLALINTVTVSGSLARLDGFHTRLYGNLTINGTAGAIKFAQVQGPSTISIGTDGVATAFDLGTVANLVITSAAPISSLTVTSWSDTDTAPDRVQARFITTLTSAGNFQPSLVLSRPGNRALDTVNIAGTVSKGAWRLAGRGGNWTLGAVAADWSASLTQNLISLTTTRVFRGTLAAKSIGPIVVGGLQGATILAGANLGADARLGGTGADADSFQAGTITSVTVNGKVVNSIVGAGLDPTDGVFRNGNDTLKTGRINSVVVSGTASANSRFLARTFPNAGPYRINGRTIVPANDARFRPDPATPPQVSTVEFNPAGTPTTVRVTFTDAQGIDVSTLGNGDLVLVGPGNTMTPLNFNFPSPTPPNGSPITGEWIILPPGGSWDAGDNGDYQIMLVANAVRDTAGAGVVGATIGMFTIAL